MLHLMVSIHGQPVAFPAAAVSAVVEIDAITPVPQVAAHILGLAAMRSRVLTVIDARAAIGLGATPTGAGVLEAVLVEVDGYGYALVVDAVDDVVAMGAPEPLRGPLAAGWADVADGLIEHGGVLVPRVDPEALVRVPAAAAA